MSEANQIHQITCDNCGEEIPNIGFNECEQCGAVLCTDCECDCCGVRNDEEF